MVEVMFWNEAGEALRIGDESKFYFENDRDATEFIENVNISDAVDATIDGVYYAMSEFWEDVDDDCSQNAPCDNSGMCAGSSCPYFWNCQN